MIRAEIIAPILLTTAIMLATIIPVNAQQANTPQNDTTVSLSSYTALLRQVLMEVDETTGSSQESLDSARAALQRIEWVRLPDGSNVRVTSMAPDHAEAPMTPERIRTMLAQIEAAHGDDTADRLAVLKLILERPEFQTQTSLWQRFWRWTRDWLRRLPLPALGEGRFELSPRLGSMIAYAVAAIASLFLIGLLSYWFQGLIRSTVHGASEPLQSSGTDRDSLSVTGATQSAEYAAAAGDFRHAVRQLYIAALLTLDEYELINYSSSATNHEMVSQLQPESDIRARLEPLTETFDRVWYGIHEPNMPTFISYKQDLQLLQKTIRRHTPVIGGTKGVSAR